MYELPASLDLANGISLPVVADSAAFRGFGAVSCRGTALRSGRLPWFVDIRSPDAVHLVDWQTCAAERRDGGWDLSFAPRAVQDGPMEWMLHTVRNRMAIGDWSVGPQTLPGTTLDLSLRPVERSIGGCKATGFSYRFAYRSTTLAIYKMLDRGSWEPEGRAEGNEFWQRCGLLPSSRIRFEGRDQHISSEWWLPTCHNPEIFQFLPFQTGMQGFTFTRSAAGVLVTWATKPWHLRSLFEKRRGTDEVLHLHEHCADLARSLDSALCEVLWIPGAFDDAAAINLYEAVRSLVWDTLHAEAKVRREWAEPYAVVEEWGMHDFARSTREAIPALAAFDMRWLMIPNQFENNMNTWGVGNYCCTVDYKVAESVGVGTLQKFCATATEHGIQVEMWGNTAISSLTKIFANVDENGHRGRIDFLPVPGSISEAYKKADDPWLLNPSGQPDPDHYCPVFCSTNLRDSSVIAYWHAAWRDLHETVGVNGIFLDSSFNLSSDKFHWAGYPNARSGATIDQVSLLGRTRPGAEPDRAILSQYHAHLHLVRTMQEYGYRYSGEDCGLFGVNRSGPSVVVRMQAPWIWSESTGPFDLPALREAGHDPRDAFVRGLAFRIMWYLYWQCDSGRVSFTQVGRWDDDADVPTAWHAARYRAFNAAEGVMRGERIVLPGLAGVLYKKNNERVLWAFRDLSLPVTAATVRDLVGRSDLATPSGTLAAQAHGVYAWCDMS
jgi:hypothetical protein